MRTLLLAWLALLGAAAQQPAHFHHIHLNTLDPAAAAQFYASHFDCEKAEFAGKPAVKTQKSWLLFTRVSHPPASAITASFWHFGWGAEDMTSEYARQLSLGARFDTPITDISDLARRQGFFFAYVDGPDHALIELNTAPFHRFGHIHLLSSDPAAAAAWYAKELGIRVPARASASKAPVFYKGFQVGPSASFVVDNVNFILFPEGYAKTAFPDLWRKRNRFDSTKGRVADHIAFSVADLPAAVARMRADGVKIVKPVSKGEGFRHAFVEGPDRLLIELVDAAPPV